MRYARFEDGVIYRSGLLTRKTSVTFFEKIQTLRIDQSPFDRRWRMATLSVDTAAAGPAGHRMQVPYLDEAFARDEFCELVHRASSYLPIYS
jgi:putative membrane protein